MELPPQLCRQPLPWSAKDYSRPSPGQFPAALMARLIGKAVSRHVTYANESLTTTQPRSSTTTCESTYVRIWG